MSAPHNPTIDNSFQALLGGGCFPLFTQSTEGAMLGANPAFYRLLGYSPDDPEDRIPNPDTFTPREFLSRDLEMLHQIRDGATGLFWRKELIRKNGTRLPVLTGASWLPDRSVFVCCCFDLSDVDQSGRQLSSLAAQLLNRGDDEKRSIARRLHDTTAQNLAALAMNLALLGPQLPDGSRAAELLDECTGLTSECLTEVRALSYMLHPPLLDELGLESALRSYAQAYSVHTAIQTQICISPGFHRLPRQVESRLFRVIQERLSYLQRHSDPTECRIELEDTGISTVITITDDAETRGNDPDNEEFIVSLAAMRERARQVSAALTVTTNAHGTTIRVILARS